MATRICVLPASHSLPKSQHRGLGWAVSSRRATSKILQQLGFSSNWSFGGKQKYKWNVGKGGAFPCHFDLPSSLSAKRLLTVLLYLNPEWTEGDGGEVELFPFPFQDAILEPLHQRLVAFSSCTSLHRVRPFVGNPGRVCLNLWFEGKVLSDHSSFPLPDLDVADSYDPRACNLHRGCWHLRFSVQFQYVRYWFCCCWYGIALILYMCPSHAMDVRTHLQSHYCTQT